MPQFYSDFSFNTDSSSQFSNPLTSLESYSTDSTILSSGSKLSAHEEANSMNFDDYSLLDYLPPEAPMFPASATNVPERFGISNTMVSPFPETNSSGYSRSNVNAIQGSGEECCRFAYAMPVIAPVAGENQAITQGGKQMTGEESNHVKIGKYSAEERKERILRYLKKRNQRNFNKTIKYACRKTLADRRVRIRGRFARNNEICEQETLSTSNNPNYQNHEKEEEFSSVFDDLHFLIENDDGGWQLEEAISNLMCLPDDACISPLTGS